MTFFTEVGSKVVNCDVLLADEAVCAHVASQLYSSKCHLKFIQLVTAGFNLLGNAVKAMNVIYRHNHMHTCLIKNALSHACTYRLLLVLTCLEMQSKQ